MIISNGLIIWKCHGCGATSRSIGYDLGSHTLWANQHGLKVRFFCHKCGSVYDVTELKGELTVAKHSMRCAIWDRYKGKEMLYCPGTINWYGKTITIIETLSTWADDCVKPFVGFCYRPGLEETAPLVIPFEVAQ